MLDGVNHIITGDHIDGDGRQFAGIGHKGQIMVTGGRITGYIVNGSGNHLGTAGQPGHRRGRQCQ